MEWYSAGFRSRQAISGVLWAGEKKVMGSLPRATGAGAASIFAEAHCRKFRTVACQLDSLVEDSFDKFRNKRIFDTEIGHGEIGSHS
jgi:hypothetical protein